MKIGFVGLGNMGAGMCANLVRAGHEVSAFDLSAEAVQAAVDAQGFQVKIGGSLFSDALGSPGTPEGTYPGMLRHNAKTLADALSN